MIRPTSSDSSSAYGLRTRRSGIRISWLAREVNRNFPSRFSCRDSILEGARLPHLMPIFVSVAAIPALIFVSIMVLVSVLVFVFIPVIRQLVCSVLARHSIRALPTGV